MKIYVCSSWRNPHYPGVVEHLRSRSFEVWDWRNPPTGGNGFRWQDCGRFGYVMGEKWSSDEWDKTLKHPSAQAGFASDLAGMNWCDVGVLLHPCGRSAHLEAGWLAGRGKTVHILAQEPVEPDLMVLALNGKIFDSTVLLSDYLFRQSGR
jgi:hypothetical protein